MATFLDISVFSYFSIVFLFLLIFTVAFAFLNYIKMFGSESKQGWNAIIALAIAAIALMSRSAIGFLSFITPWFVILFFVLFFIIFAVRMFGLGEKDMVEVIKDAWPWVLTLSIIIVLFGLGNTLGQNTLQYTLPAAGASEGATGTADAGTGTGTGSADAGNSDGATTTDVGTTSSSAAKASTATASFQQNLYATIFHPKVLGMFFLLIIATVTIAFLAQRTTGA